MTATSAGPARNATGHAGGMQDLLLHLSKWCGLFRLSRFLTRRGVRILCYHGFAHTDETDFRPSLFITLATFERRLRSLAESRYSVVSLDSALEAMDRNAVTRDLVVITVDDVFHNFLTEACPVLERYRFPSTAYVTTYYSDKGTPVFRLVVRYSFWKTRQTSLDLSKVHPGLEGTFNLSDRAMRAAAEETVIGFGEGLSSEDGRVAVLDRLGRALEVDIDSLRRARMFNIVTREEIRGLVARGVDIQLHTHRHRLPVDPVQTQREIDDNRRVLEPLAGRRLAHFCYPSGIWSQVHWPGLEQAGVRSATTCDSGLNFSTTPRLGLKRILDAEDVSLIRFEAEVSGFKHLLRSARGLVHRPPAGE